MPRKAPERGWITGRKRGYYSGNRAAYLFGRLRAAGVDVQSQVAAGTFKSIRASAAKAGIIFVPDPEDAKLERLLNAWRLAPVVTREVFLALIEDWEDLPERRRHGPQPDKLADEAPAALRTLAGNMPMAALARELNVSRETVRRWCAGTTQPLPKHLAAMKRMAAAADTDGSAGR